MMSRFFFSREFPAVAEFRRGLHISQREVGAGDKDHQGACAIVHGDADKEGSDRPVGKDGKDHAVSDCPAQGEGARLCGGGTH